MVTSPVKERLLIVDDAVDTLEVLQRNLAAQGFEVLRAQAVAEAIELLDRTPVDLVITDLKMPGASGLELVRHVREKLPDTEVMMITGFPSIEGAVEAVRLGAEDYVPKPFTQEELQLAVRRALGKLKARRAGRPTAERPANGFINLVGRSEPMRRVFESVVLAAGTTAPVVLSGEPGTGKEQIAREIHYNGARARAPFVAVCCGKVPQEILEGELFGDADGATTSCVEPLPAVGASPRRQGLFQLVSGGTLYLQEIAELGLPLQDRLASAIDESPAARPGPAQPTGSGVRVIAGTTRDLPALANKGLFREELLLKLGGIVISLPPLRQRGDDLLLLARHFLERAARPAGRAAPQLAPAVLDAMASYPWPGNLGELRAVMEGILLQGDRDPVELADLPPFVRTSRSMVEALRRSLADVEAEHIRDTLASVQGNKTRCAKILGIDRKTLREKMRIYDL